MAGMWACLAVLLFVGTAQVAAQCVCKTVPDCPHVFGGPRVTPCIMSQGKGIGLCCPPKSGSSVSPPSPKPASASAPKPAATPAPTPAPAPPATPAPEQPKPPAAAPKPPAGARPAFPKPFPGFPFFPPRGFPSTAPKAPGLPPLAASQISISRTASQPDPAVKSSPNTLTARSIPHNLHSGPLGLAGAKPKPPPSPPSPPPVKPPVPAAQSSATRKPSVADFLKFLQQRGIKPPPGFNPEAAKSDASGAASPKPSPAAPQVPKVAQPAAAVPVPKPSLAPGPEPAEPSPAPAPSDPAGGPPPPPTPGKEVKPSVVATPVGALPPKLPPGAFPPPKPGLPPFGPVKRPGLPVPIPGFPPGFPPALKGQRPPFVLPPKFPFPFPKSPVLTGKPPGVPASVPGAPPKAIPQPATGTQAVSGSKPAGEPAAKTPSTPQTAPGVPVKVPGSPPAAIPGAPVPKPGLPAGIPSPPGVRGVPGIPGIPSTPASQSPKLPGFPILPGLPNRKLSANGVEVSPLGGIINPAANVLGRPTSGPGAAPIGAPATGGPVKPGAKPETQPGPQPPQPGSQQPGAQSGTQPGVKPGAQPGIQPGAQPGARPGVPPGVLPGAHLGVSPSAQNGVLPGAPPGALPNILPATRPGTRPGPPGSPGPPGAPRLQGIAIGQTQPTRPKPGVPPPGAFRPALPPPGAFKINANALGRTPPAAPPPAAPVTSTTAGRPGVPTGGFKINANALGRVPAPGAPSSSASVPATGSLGATSPPSAPGGFQIRGNALERQSSTVGRNIPGQFVQPSTPAVRPGTCVPLILCPPLVAKQDLLYSNWCRLRDGSLGFSCSYEGTKLPSVTTGLSVRSTVGTGPGSPLANMRPMNIYTTGSRDFRKATEEAATYLNDASLAAEEFINQQEITAANLVSTNQVPGVSTPTNLFAWNSQATVDAAEIGLWALHALSTVQNLEILAPGTVQKIKSTGPDGPSVAAEAAVAALYAGTQPEPTPDQLPLITPDCEPRPEIFCEETNYRSINGQCNNLKTPYLGSSMTGHKRLISDTYDDGIFAMRTKTIRGGQLPSARIVSERVLDTFSNELRDWTLSLMQIGQFVANDLSKTHVFRLNEAEGVECCLNSGFVFPAPPVHPQCISIPIKITDPFYGQFGQRCMGMTRSLPAVEPDCIARPARPLNEYTSFLDGSHIYGSEPTVTEELRQFHEGLMRTSEVGDLLPMTGPPGPEMPCRAGVCFLSGDTRVNQHSGLTVVHTIWLREHNRIARYLVKRHPDWSDEQLFQETRRIVIAEWQHIVYNEYVPAILGFDYADAHGLLPLKKGFSNYYDEKIDPSVSVSFASAAMRFGHSMVRDMYDLLDANGQVFRVVNLTTTFFEPTVVSDAFVGHARTLVARRSEAVDTNVAKTIQQQLFTTNFQYGMDLIAINIQRGRDHGTPTYAQAAEACGVVQVHYWGDLHRVMESKTIDKLRSVYDDPRDVDLHVGGMAEKLAPGAQVGPTFQCLIAQQFFDVRYGDRFFYDNGGLAHSFTEVQLGEIRKTSWARILCDTLGADYQNDFNKVQPLALVTTLGRNQVLSCNTLAIPHGELSAF